MSCWILTKRVEISSFNSRTFSYSCAPLALSILLTWSRDYCSSLCNVSISSFCLNRLSLSNFTYSSLYLNFSCNYATSSSLWSSSALICLFYCVSCYCQLWFYLPSSLSVFANKISCSSRSWTRSARAEALKAEGEWLELLWGRGCREGLGEEEEEFYVGWT